MFSFLVEDVNDFSSKEAMESNGWVFNLDGDHVFVRGGKFCRNVLSTSYCGFVHPQDLTLSYTFSYSGTANLQYGQSWDKGSVHVKKNNEEIDSRSSRGSSNTTFAFSLGDVLHIIELGASVINIHKLSLQKSCEK